MNSPPRQILPAFGIAGPVLLASLATRRLRVPPILGLLMPALVAVATVLMRHDRTATDPSASEQQALARAAQAEARVQELTQATSQLRHDLRGILSPAMLMADRLAMSDDPVSRRAGESMISTIERADARLKPPPS